MQIVLASQSRYRASQLRLLGLNFDQQASHISEDQKPDEDAQSLALRLAESKAAFVANSPQYSEGFKSGKTVVIGSDQSVCFNGNTLGKPGNFENALSQLKQFSGNKVIFHTALCVLSREKTLCNSTQTSVTFNELNEQQIKNYIERDKPYDCAGSFKSESLGISLFKCVESEDPSALIGLPLILLCQFLRTLGLDPLLDNDLPST